MISGAGDAGDQATLSPLMTQCNCEDCGHQIVYGLSSGDERTATTADLMLDLGLTGWVESFEKGMMGLRPALEPRVPPKPGVESYADWNLKSEPHDYTLGAFLDQEALCGTGVSILMKLPPVSVYGETTYLILRTIARLFYGVVGTLVGLGVLVLGLVNVNGLKSLQQYFNDPHDLQAAAGLENRILTNGQSAVGFPDDVQFDSKLADYLDGT